MPIKVTTTYTKENLLRYSYAIALSSPLWPVLIVGTLVILILYSVLRMMGGGSDVVNGCLTLVIVYDVLMPALFFVPPRFIVKKAKELDTVVEYSFGEDAVEMSSCGTHASDTSTVKYTMLSKVYEKNGFAYLMITRNRGFIVELRGLSDEEKKMLKSILVHALGEKKVKW